MKKTNILYYYLIKKKSNFVKFWRNAEKIRRAVAVKPCKQRVIEPFRDWVMKSWHMADEKNISTDLFIL